ncbi:hypothetical protein K413DRAFT_2426 [Clostridium sp. ASBs410]|jgi:hypothetical protein|nr:hypothetical protein K413DRAFT_2426 [Clostridium sp. ASBs410]
MLNEKVTDLICEGMLLDINDPSIADIWDELTHLLSVDSENTINYLSGCNEKEIEFLSAVFEDVAYNLKSNRYINELENLKNKIPNLNLDSIISLAKEYSE